MLFVSDPVRRSRPSLRLLPLLALLLIAAFTGPGCRPKDNPYTPPNPSDTTVYHLVLRSDPIVYTDASGHVNNDTITVRLYDQDGRLQNGITVHSRSLGDPGKCTAAVVTTADTVHNWWGTGVTPLVYWGVGADNGEDVQETIYSFVIDPTDSIPDTLARATVTFSVRPGTTKR